MKPATLVNIRLCLQSVVPCLGHYCASKAGIISLTKTTAKELVGSGIRCNAVMPGAVDTPILSAGPPEALAAYCQVIPMGRLGTSKGNTA